MLIIADIHHPNPNMPPEETKFEADVLCKALKEKFKNVKFLVRQNDGGFEVWLDDRAMPGEIVYTPETWRVFAQGFLASRYLWER